MIVRNVKTNIKKYTDYWPNTNSFLSYFFTKLRVAQSYLCLLKSFPVVYLPAELLSITPTFNKLRMLSTSLHHQTCLRATHTSARINEQQPGPSRPAPPITAQHVTPWALWEL